MYITVVDLNDQYQQKDYAALREQQCREGSAWVWKNDRTAVGLALLSEDTALREITVTAGSFSDGSGHTLRPTVSRLGEVKAFIGNAGWYAQNPEGILPTGPKEDYFDVLYEGGYLRELPPRQVALFWLAFSADAETYPGVYRGTVTVTTESGETDEIICTLEVLNAALNDDDFYTFRPNYWVYPFRIADYYGVEPFEEEHLAILRAHLLQYKAYGGFTLSGTLVEEAWGGQTYGRCPSMIDWIRQKDGSWRYDYTYLDRYIELAESIGLGEDIVLYSPIPWGNRITYYDEAAQEQRQETVEIDRYEEFWLPFLQALAEHLDETGRFDRVSLGFDERPKLEAVFNLIDQVKNREGKVFQKQCAYNTAGQDDIAKRIKNLSLNLNLVRKYPDTCRTLVESRRQAGQHTTFYTATDVFPNTFLRSVPAEGYWTMMYAGALSLDGFLDWAYDAWVEDPLTDATHSAFQPGDCFMVYPNDRGRAEQGSRLSIRSEKYGEGIRDINKLCQIRAELPELAGEIDALFSAVPSNYDHDTVENEPGWSAGNRAARWLTPAGKAAILADVTAFRRGVYEISKKYIDKVFH